MVHFCTVPGCSNRSDRETHLSYHRLPLKRKNILKEWIHKVGRVNLPLNESTRVCSEHFVKSTGRMLQPNEVPSQKLPVLRTRVSSQLPRRHIVRYELTERRKSQQVQVLYRDAGVNTDLTGADLELLEAELLGLKEKVQQLEQECAESKEKQYFRLKNIGDVSTRVRFTPFLQQDQY